MAGQRMRKLRGMEIVARGGQIRRVANSLFIVQSQVGNGWYEVRWKGHWVCNCPDYLKRGVPCKHIYAVVFLSRLPEILLTNAKELSRSPRRPCDIVDMVAVQ